MTSELEQYGPCPHPIAKLRGTLDQGFNWVPCNQRRGPISARHGGGFTCGLHRTTADDTFETLYTALLADGTIFTGPIRFKETEIC